MVETVTTGEKCPVCGHVSTEAVCPRCGTILLKDQAICPECGAMFHGIVAMCDRCGREMRSPSPSQEEASAIRALTLVPGVDEGTARRLYSKGFRDFSDVLKATLPHKAVERGLHVTIARQLVLAELSPPSTQPPGKVGCASCGELAPATARACPSCGASLAFEDRSRAMERRLAKATTEVPHYETDPDFRTMPESVQREIISAMGSEDLDLSLRTHFLQQIEAWRGKGFEVSLLVKLLDRDPEAFRTQGVRMIRAQILKRRDAGTFRCPLCDDVLPPTVEECGNCGAKFA